MSIEEFNNLPIDKQVEYINKELELSSLNKICKSLGVSESTVRDRFKRNNYKRVDNKFIRLETTSLIQTTTKKKLKPTKKSYKKDTSLDSIKLLEEKIKALESQIEATNKRIDTITTTKKLQSTTESIKRFNGDDVPRSFRVNVDIQARFKKYCKENANYKVSDILSTALEEFLNNRNS